MLQCDESVLPKVGDPEVSESLFLEWKVGEEVSGVKHRNVVLDASAKDQDVLAPRSCAVEQDRAVDLMCVGEDLVGTDGDGLAAEDVEYAVVCDSDEEVEGFAEAGGGEGERSPN